MSNSVVYNSDCLAAMRAMPDKAFDLAIVDPPYGIEDKISVGGGSHTKANCTFHQLYSENGKRWDKVPEAEYFTELFRVSKNQIIWGGNYFPLPIYRSFIVWDKLRFVPNFSRYELAWTSFDRHATLFTFCNNGGFLLRGTVKFHPTQKPVELYKWLIVNYAKDGDKILDTHLGSGSSRIAAHDLGFDFVGYELDKDYFDAQERRFAEHIAQGTLFVPEAATVTQEAMF